MATALYEPTVSPTANGNLRRSIELVRLSAFRALKVRYRGTALGILWSFFNPVLMTVVYTAIFGTAFAQYYDGSVSRYLISAFCGLVVVTFFMNATSEALTSIVTNGQLLNKIALPPLMFPVASVVANVFQQGMTTFPIVLLLSVVLTHDPVRIALVPFVLASIVLLVTGISLMLATLFVFFRDLPHLWAVMGFILWLTSPMFYPMAVVPANLRPWFTLNPVGHAISALREVAMTRGPLDMNPIIIAFCAGLAALALGAWFFRASRPAFMDLL